MSIKLTIVYDNPKDPAAFETRYRTTHADLVRQLTSVERIEVAKVFPKEDGSATPAYRTSDLYFADYTTACATIASAPGKAMIDDAVELATGGVRFLLSEVETV